MRPFIRTALLLTFSSFCGLLIPLAKAAPSITSLSPATGAVGASVTITGTNFGSSQGSSTVKFNGTTATTSSWSATSIVLSVPTGATTGNVVVTVSGVASNGKSFSVVAAPSIASLSPGSGAVGASVTIGGSNFGSTKGSSTVNFNGTVASTTSWSATSIGATVPAGSTTGNVVVHASGVDSNGKSFTVFPTPNIATLSPASGAMGASVTVGGTNFGPTQGTSTIKFNGTTGTATTWSDTSIVVPVPTGAASGNVVVTVNGVSSNGKSFTVVAAPSITSLSPTSGISGTSVTISGSNFGSSQGSATVTFSGVATNPTNWSATSIKAPVPSGAGTGNVIVHASGVDSNGNLFTVIVPSITSVSPNPAAVGASVTIAGNNFGSSQGTSTLTFNGTVATVTTWNATSISAQIPTGATTGNVLVTVSGSVSNAYPLTVLPPPVITSITPSSGLVGASVTISGTGFGSSPGQLFFNGGGLAATINTWSATTIATTVPTGAVSSGVFVAANGVYSNQMVFTVVPPPSISSLTPSVGPVGGAIRVSGAGFQSDATITFNGLAATITSLSSNYLTAVVPAGASTGNVIVHSSGLDSNGIAFSVSAPPTVTGISPAAGPTGTLITITGSGFGATKSTSMVKINGSGVSTNTWGDTTIKCSVGSWTSSGPLVVSVAGVDSNPQAFSVSGSSIVSVTPLAAAIGDLISIRGIGFGTTQGSSSIQFNGITGFPTDWTDTSIVVPVPVGTTTGLIQVTANGSPSNTFAFTLLPSPTITSVSPISAPAGSVVTIQGTAFGSTQGNSTVTVNGNSAVVNSWSDTQIQAVIPNGATTSPVMVVANGIQSNMQSITVTPPSPTSFIIAPSAIAIVIGQTKQLSLMGDGNVITGASWTSSNSSIARISTSDPPILTGVSAGSATITALYAGHNTTANVTVYTDAVSIPIGTVLWSAPPIVSAVSSTVFAAESTSADDPDLYAVDQLDSTTSIVRAFNSEGRQLFTLQSNGAQFFATDAQAGLLSGQSTGSTYGHSSISRNDPHSGTQTWSSTSPAGLQLGGAMAVDSKGTTYIYEFIGGGGSCAPTNANCAEAHVVAIDGQTGKRKFAVPLPLNHDFGDSCGQSCFVHDSYYSPAVGNITIGPDDTVYVEVASYTMDDHWPSGQIYSENRQLYLDLFSIRSSGMYSKVRLGTAQHVFTSPPDPSSLLWYIPGRVIPTDKGVILANYIQELTCSSPCTTSNTNWVTRVVNGSPVANYQVSAPIQVVGENGAVYGSDGNAIRAYDAPSGSNLWSASTNGSLVAATSHGAVVTSGSTVSLFDQSGTPTSYDLGIQNASYRSLGEWTGLIASGVAGSVRGPSFDIALSYAPYVSLSRGKRQAAQIFWSAYHIPVDLSVPGLANGYYEPNFESDMISISNSTPSLAIPQFRKFEFDPKETFLNDIKNPTYQILGFIGHSLPGPNGGPYQNKALGVCFLYQGDPRQTGFYYDCISRSGFYEDPTTWPYDPTTGLVTAVNVHLDKLQIASRITFVGVCDFNDQFAQLWTPGDPDQAIVVPVQNNAEPDVDLAVAAQFWRELMKHMATGDTIGVAKDKANQFVLTIPNSPPPNSPPGTPANPPFRWEQWAVVGNSNLKLPN